MHSSLIQAMGSISMAEAWLCNRVRASRKGTEGVSLGEEELLDRLENHPLFAGGKS